MVKSYTILKILYFCIKTLNTLLTVLLFISSLALSKGQYLNLDKDHNGMLSKEELSRYGTATLTSVFLDRVFQEYLTYDGEMVRSAVLADGQRGQLVLSCSVTHNVIRNWSVCWLQYILYINVSLFS